MNNTSENNTTERTETQARTERKNIWGVTAELWEIMYTPKGYKVNTQMLIERYTQHCPIRYAENGAYYKYLSKGVWEETDNRHIRKVLRRIVNYFVPYIWSGQVNSSVLCHLPLICDSFERLRPATNFINHREWFA